MKPDRRRIHIKKGAFNLEEEALRASGIKEKDRIVHYKNKLGSLIQNFIEDIPPTLHSFSRAEALFHWLWKEKPARYQSHGHNRIDEHGVSDERIVQRLIEGYGEIIKQVV